jgi:BioD-like phosphotransacetylase family protein
MGLISALKKRVSRVGYIKPVGQRYVEIDGQKIDEDAFLIKEVYGLVGDITDTSPVAIPRHFTENYIDSPNPEPLERKVLDAFARVAEDKDIVVVEGTGHAGVGSVFDMSNGRVASMLGCKAIIISSGGVGQPIDEIMLNKATFDAAGVEILGVIINKVEEAKYDKVKSYVTRGFALKGLEVLGVMPYRSMLSSPTIGQLLRSVNGKLLCGTLGLMNLARKIVVGAMPTHEALTYLTQDTLLITPGVREDLILAAMSHRIIDAEDNHCIAGMILTGGTPPQPGIVELLDKADIPAIIVDEDTFSVASKVAKLIVKVRPTDSEKITLTEEIVEEFVNVDRILEKLKEHK